MSKIYYKLHIYENPDTSLKQENHFDNKKKEQNLQPKNYEKYWFLKIVDDIHKRRRKVKESSFLMMKRNSSTLYNNFLMRFGEMSKTMTDNAT